ncbi:uncharacterized protein LOC115992271 [Quercus lobata]|uniref:uncharacterized protein LOC115992271 n=1 Tax=Quercus lobata TaxID=97700 RepID=UPI001244A4D8|nr:uncharacterized protein LOC115992271 [Quercus lobata]
MFKPQLGRNIEVYIDDMVVKSKVVSGHMGDLTSIFGILRKHKLRLNASKCSFGVSSKKFLGYMLTHRGIEVNPDQIKAINGLQAPRNPKEVKKLTGMTATLNRFISRFADSPEVDEVLFAYLAVAFHAVIFVLIREDSGIQRPIYYLKSILWSADYIGRITKWGTILGAFDIKYMPRTSVKGQVIADLVAEFAELPEEAEVKQHDMDEKSVGLISTQDPSSWKVYVDGAANQRGAGVGLVLVSPEKIIIEKSLRLGFSATNNEAEYEVLLMGMTMIQKMGGKVVKMFSDSRLIVGQVKGELEARDTRMQEYLGQIRRIQTKFESFDLSYIPKGENTHADSLATLATSSARNLPQVIIIEDLYTPTPTRKDLLQIHQVNLGPSWMDLILLFLIRNILPGDKSEAEKVRRKAPRFWLSEDKKLYKRSFSEPYLLCVHPEISESLLEELHKGICGSHTGGRSLSHRAITQGYWWPDMQRNAQEYVRKCDQCQRFAPNIHQPRGVLNPLSSPWPFAQ